VLAECAKLGISTRTADEGLSIAKAEQIAEYAKPPKTQRKKPTAVGNRIRQLQRERKEVVAGEPSAAEFFDLLIQINREVNYLEGTAHHIEAVRLHERTREQLEKGYDDLLRLRVSLDKVQPAFEALRGEQEQRNLIAKLRNVTVANGATPDEEESAKARLKLAEARLQRRLNGGS
jgi:DNA repair ATPase RecN